MSRAIQAEPESLPVPQVSRLGTWMAGVCYKGKRGLGKDIWGILT